MASAVLMYPQQPAEERTANHALLYCTLTKFHPGGHQAKPPLPSGSHLSRTLQPVHFI